MIPHISLTEMIQAGAFVFVVGAIFGAFVVYKLDSTLSRKKR